MTERERERQRQTDRQTEKEGATERHVRIRSEMTLTIIFKMYLK
jgi:hypothetical protein